jgi:hypothetical protein
MPLDMNIGEAGTESEYEWAPLSKDLDCSVSDASDESGELLRSLHVRWPRTGKFWELRSTGLP